MLTNRRQFLGFPVDGSIPYDVCWYDVDEVSQPGHMVEVRMTEEYFQSIGPQIFSQAAHTGARIEHDADIRQHHARSLTLARREITAGSEQDDVHRSTLWGQVA